MTPESDLREKLVKVIERTHRQWFFDANEKSWQETVADAVLACLEPVANVITLPMLDIQGTRQPVRLGALKNQLAINEGTQLYAFKFPEDK